MKVNINKKEFEAISFAINQINANIEAGANDDYCKEGEHCVKALQEIIKKYKYETEKYGEFLYWRRVISERNRSRNLLAKEIDRMTRAFIKRLHQEP